MTDIANMSTGEGIVIKLNAVLQNNKYLNNDYHRYIS